MGENIKIYLGADHRGYSLKEKIFQWLVDAGDYVVEDYGAYELIPNDDYTLYAEKVASVVGSSTRARPLQSRGILFCGSGVGVDVVANKFDGARASIGKEPRQIEAGREDDDMNLLVVAADFTSESEAKKMIEKFLSTEYESVERHDRRLEDIRRIEENN